MVLFHGSLVTSCTPVPVAQNGCPSLELCHLSVPALIHPSVLIPNFQERVAECSSLGRGSAPVHSVAVGAAEAHLYGKGIFREEERKLADLTPKTVYYFEGRTQG